MATRKPSATIWSPSAHRSPTGSARGREGVREMSTVPTRGDGRRTTPYGYGGPTEVDTPEKGTGWLTFAAVMLGLAGTLGVIYGIVAVAQSSFFVADAHFVFSDLNTWGWITMAVGAVTILTAFGVAVRSAWARWTGIVLAGLQAIAQLLMIQAYPFWALCVFAIDLLVIYALAAYGGARTRFEG